MSGQPKTQQPQQQQHRPPASRHFTQADLNKLVLEYLARKGYQKTEATLRIESTKIPGSQTIALNPGNVNYEVPKAAAADRSGLHYQQQQFVREQKAAKLRNYDEDPKMYGRAYSMFRTWCENSLEMYRYELEKFLFPLFVYMYLRLVERSDAESGEARHFFETFKADHVMQHGYEVRALGGVSLAEHVEQNTVSRLFKHNKYKVHMSSTSLNLVLGFLNEFQAIGGGILVQTINTHVEVETQMEVTTKAQDETEAVDRAEGIPAVYELANSSSSSSNNNNTAEELNSKALKLGRMAGDPEYSKELEAELKHRDEQEADKAKKDGTPAPAKTLVQEYQDKFKVEAGGEEDSPSRDVLPLPQKNVADLRKEIAKIQDSRASIRLNLVQAHLPSVCMYTFHHANNGLTCAEFNDDSTVLASGFEDSFVKLWSLDGSPLKSVLKHDAYNETAEGGLALNNSRRLIGHSGAVYGLDFSPDNHYLLSASEDKTARLWSLDTYTPLVSYRSHNAPVWDVKFSPLGHYFATASHDQTARLWSCDHVYPLRIFAGHLNDVDVVEFHPNSTYLFTGSSDRTVRMWDIARGEAVRVFIGHTQAVNALACSPDGRWLATAGEDAVINVFDIASGRKLKSMHGHGKSSIYSLSFSRDGSVLVSGGADNSVRVWDVKRGTMDSSSSSQPEKFTYESVVKAKNGDETTRVDNMGTERGATRQDAKRRKEVAATQDHMAVYFTKKTPVYKVHFTRRNLCLAAGVYEG